MITIFEVAGGLSPKFVGTLAQDIQVQLMGSEWHITAAYKLCLLYNIIIKSRGQGKKETCALLHEDLLLNMLPNKMRINAQSL